MNTLQRLTVATESLDPHSARAKASPRAAIARILSAMKAELKDIQQSYNGEIGDVHDDIEQLETQVTEIITKCRKKLKTL